MSSRNAGGNPFVAGGINPSSKGKDVSGASIPKVEQLSQGVSDWVGVDNDQFLDDFRSDGAIRAWQSYDRRDGHHLGMSVLAFNSTGMGYKKAEHLHKRFAEVRRGRKDWELVQGNIDPHVKPRIYGYMAVKEDLDHFNKYSKGENLTFEMKSYQNMVVKQIRQMSENKVAKEQRVKHAVEESFGIMSEKIRKAMEENRIVRQRTLMQHAENKEQMDKLEESFNERIKKIRDARDEKEEKFEKLQQEEREKVIRSSPRHQEEIKPGQYKWIGITDKELREVLNSFEYDRVRHSYDSNGHRGMSVLIFKETAKAYIEAKRLDKHFADQGADRKAWDLWGHLPHPGGKRQLYGYMALEKDLVEFNTKSKGKSPLQFQMISYQDKVGKEISQMSENKVAEEQRVTHAILESFGIMGEKIRKAMEENRISRQGTLMQHPENKEQMDEEEKEFNERIKKIRDARDEENRKFEKFMLSRVLDELAISKEFQDEQMKFFDDEKEKLTRLHEKEITKKRQDYWADLVKLERKLDNELEESCVMKVNINCETCRKKVMEVLQNLHGIYSVVIDADSGQLKVSGKVNPYIILKVFEKYGKHGEVSCVKFDGEVREPFYNPYYGGNGYIPYGPGAPYPHIGGPIDYYHRPYGPPPPFPHMPPPPLAPPYLRPRPPPPPPPVYPKPAAPPPPPKPVINYFPPKAPVVAPPKELDCEWCKIM
ncbi:hypothetical protein CCACVL1_11247 [Corchorus capsularis]|uniref:HMA domain-containing protein n=1 Tax=Corchorus capsularis TaxID=210143 RepID=A0A1R3IMA4_COCAP|nr:hypothetical protein CCACVL1_11247 [Corchorus capsularis]